MQTLKVSALDSVIFISFDRFDCVHALVESDDIIRYCRNYAEHANRTTRLFKNFLLNSIKSRTECFKLLHEVYEEVDMSRTPVFERRIRFSRRRRTSGRPSKSETDDNIEKVNEIVRNDR